ncbi:MAG: TetR/AcrR family transcriptional regulator [Myxococcaceae bacterium]|jgi:AcrR family transcriptional regulator|nr:TetR/AcrR family transcriptional regulator [Myxococcaceae bacterium]MCA3012836.1 TetR/AcrR family transcriptional regulator [Myxococcaceae bacterium]
MPKVVDHDAVRAALIGRASGLFVERGYAGVGMREVAAAAGVPKSSLYHYFPTKEALLAEVCRTWMEAELEVLRGLVAPHRSPRARLEACVEWTVRAEKELLATSVVLLDASAPRGSPAIAALFEAYVEGLADVVGLTQERVRVLLATMVGGVLLRQIDGGRLELHAIGRWLVNTLAGRPRRHAAGGTAARSRPGDRPARRGPSGARR